jgi:hypothetical protein
MFGSYAGLTFPCPSEVVRIRPLFCLTDPEPDLVPEPSSIAGTGGTEERGGVRTGRDACMPRAGQNWMQVTIERIVAGPA